MAQRPYLYYDSTISLCSTCLRRIDAKILIQDGSVYLDKRCQTHGKERVLLSEDALYWQSARQDYLKASDMPLHFQTEVRHGCPYDCGLCPDHEQHSCLTLIEICDACNLSCPVCYAESGPSRQSYRSLDEIGDMLDCLVRSEGEPDVVQISGGEPTEHPDLFEVLTMVKNSPVHHLMLNSNGIRIASEEGFAEKLAAMQPGFEIYLQFDSLQEGPLRELRGADLRDLHRRALDRLEEVGLSTTLVVTCKKGLNDGELGALLDHALSYRCVRGLTIQPIQDAGRNLEFDPAKDRLTASGIRRRLLEQSELFVPEDLIPVPCHPDRLVMGYALKLAGEAHPLTRYLDPTQLLQHGSNSIVMEKDPALRDKVVELFSTGNSPAQSATKLASLLCCLPSIEAPGQLGYDNLFRVVIMEFLDAHSFDLRSMRKSCVHIAHPDGQRLIPFDSYNLFYRDELEQEVLAPIRAEGAHTMGEEH